MSRYLKPQILQAFNSSQHALIEASAGTGKTYTIAHILLDLVLAGLPIRSVLLMTFTEKATAELRVRVRELLEKVLNLPDDYGLSFDPEQSWELGPAQRKLLREALADFDGAAIHTLHGFCNRVLGDYAFENLQFFETEKVSKNQALEAFLPSFLRKEVMADPLLRRLLFAYLRERPAALVGLEMGEEEAYGESLLRMLRDLVGKQATLLPQYGPELEQAWSDWKRAFEAEPLLAQFEQLNIHASTLKSFVKRLTEIRIWFQNASLEDLHGIEIAAQLHELELAKIGDGGEWNFTAKAKPGKINEFSAIPQEMKRFLEANRALLPFLAPQESFLIPLLATRLKRAFQKDKAAAGRIDFDDMIRLVAEKLAREDGIPLQKALRERYRVAIIDEFQDTDAQQWQIFSSLFLQPSHGLLLIGDPKQAIYRFRGADIHTYLLAREHYLRSGFRVATLAHNYRSTAELVAALNRIFEMPEFFGREIPFEPVAADPGLANQPPTAGFIPITGLAVETAACRDEKGRLGLANLRRVFAERVVDGIAALLANEARIVPTNEGPRRVAPGDIMVLVRTRKEAETLGKILRERGIAFSFFKQGGLFKTLEAHYLHDLLRAIETPSEAHCFQALLTPFYPQELGDLMETPVLPPEIQAQMAGWRDVLQRKRDFRAFFNAIFSETRIFERLLLLGDDERALTNYEQLADLLTREGRGRTLDWLVRRLWLWIMGEGELDEDLLRLETERKTVQLMTKHVSKGLEFPFVFLYGDLGAGRNAAYHEYQDPNLGRVIDLAKRHREEHEREENEESARLDYVALTRAKYGLFLPVFVDGAPEEWQKVLGGYGRIHQRVAELLARNEPGFCFDFSREKSHAQLNSEVSPLDASPSHWFLPEGMGQMERLRRRAFSLRLASYTRLSGLEAARSEGEGDRLLSPPKAADELSLEALVPATQEQDVRKQLPGGATTGICLHEILEQMDLLQPFRFPEQGFEDWRKDPVVAALIAARAAAAGLEPHQEALARFAWHGARMRLPIGVAIGALDAKDRVAEVDFLYPMRLEPERTAFLTGSIDIAFRFAGRYYFADWKSDRMPQYAAAFLESRVQEHYQIQIEIYVWAMLRWLGIRDRADYEARFGGFCYLFLRGMPMGEGVYLHRPSWDEACSYQGRLRERLESREPLPSEMIENVRMGD